MKPQPQPTTQEVLAGPVERVTFHNEETGFCVLRIKARGHRELVTVIGHAAVISAGEWITASGEWINDRTHGETRRRRAYFRKRGRSAVRLAKHRRYRRPGLHAPQAKGARDSRGGMMSFRTHFRRNPAAAGISNCNVCPAVQIAVITSILQQEGLPCVYHSFLRPPHLA